MAGDARGYSWPPFEPGNTKGRRHGAFSKREIEPLADDLALEVTEKAPWASADHFAPGVRRYARAEAIASKLWAYVVEHGPLDEEGNPRPALDKLDRWEAAAAARGAALGLDPTSMAKLLGSFAAVPGGEDALAALQAEGRRIIQARERSLEPVHEGDDDPDPAA